MGYLFIKFVDSMTPHNSSQMQGVQSFFEFEFPMVTQYGLHFEKAKRTFANPLSAIGQMTSRWTETTLQTILSRYSLENILLHRTLDLKRD